MILCGKFLTIVFNPFYVICHFLYTLKTLEKKTFLHTFRGYSHRVVIWMAENISIPFHRHCFFSSKNDQWHVLVIYFWLNDDFVSVNFQYQICYPMPKKRRSPITFNLTLLRSFSLRISSANVPKSSGICGFGHINWRNS